MSPFEDPIAGRNPHRNAGTAERRLQERHAAGRLEA